MGVDFVGLTLSLKFMCHFKYNCSVFRTIGGRYGNHWDRFQCTNPPVRGCKGSPRLFAKHLSMKHIVVKYLNWRSFQVIEPGRNHFERYLFFMPLPALQNLKKSWHPQTFHNLERVWKAQQKDEREKKKIQDLQQEIREERAREEMQRMAVESGITK